jgi:glycosyltransferase involved in cell wall biosynthesis
MTNADCQFTGAVAIGRNEGERLRRCLESVRADASSTVYVDSGSRDASVALARGLGVHVVELDMRLPFTAARARNAGFAHLIEIAPTIEFVQFVDGDCEVVAGWMTQAAAFLCAQHEVAVVCGRRRERFPDRSVFNRLCDLEWDTPCGEAKACGGDALMRRDAFDAAGGFRDDLIAGEEPELCVRLRAAGSRIWRLDAEMTLHDAAITRFGQWWKRTLRGGYAFAEGSLLHGAPPERHWVAESRRAWLWGLGIPLLTLLAIPLFGAYAATLLLVYPLQWLRLATANNTSANYRGLRALFLILSKFPEAVGQLTYFYRRLLGARGRLIEYK